ncbi:hypothetical protein [Alteromonas naphthalenivorans]|uniref:Sulfotransferase family protein n=1 Tax=Alteromonas naphthalenivorans TaxID=715451 RepID=F5Z663_ALTNA|nr:hypothetical protein [Alteromonas naphthalenivorans]AEF05296.1 hypothetical protein ambt_19015 [Alteromonas naphthalenivorans]|tara:strand:+ start:954 stop:1628 length:675 start_codon:yes stop_codon:yes gene_type:complete
MLNSFFSRQKINFSDTLWLSHHIPKTAGTSLRIAFDDAVGRKEVRKVYRPFEVVSLERGKITLPRKLPFIIHGHFKPSPEQLAIAPSIKRAVWLRDPVQRAWSLLKHLIDAQNYKNEYEILNRKFGGRLVDPDPEVLEYFLSNKEFAHLNRPYQNYFKSVRLHEFDFVGKIENFEGDLSRLGHMMNIKLSSPRVNERRSEIVIHQKDFMHYLEKEYDVVKDYYE